MSPLRIATALIAAAVLTPAAAGQAAATTTYTLDITLRHAGNVMTVRGSVKPGSIPTRVVQITVRHGKHVPYRFKTRLDAAGRFSVRLTPVPLTGPLTVRVNIGSLYAKRTVA